MMVWDVFALWLVSAGLLQLVAARQSPPRTVLALMLQHAQVAAAAVCVLLASALLLPAWAVAWSAAGLWALGTVVLALDSGLQLHFGLRLEFGYIHFLRDIRLFDRFWVAHLTAAVAATTLAWLGAATWLTQAAPLQNNPLYLASWAAAAAGLAALGVLMWRRLPAQHTYGWNNRIFATQMAWGLGKLRQQRAADADVPALFTAQHEEAEKLDPKYPLWRRTRAFVGPSHFSVRMDAHERPHVVMLFMESFGARDIGALGSPHAVTPQFDAWSKRGILWNNFYANGTSTARGALAGLYSLPPRFSEVPAQAHQPPAAVGLADLFNKRGYHSAYFHNGPSQFEKKNPFFFNHGYASMHDRDALRRIYPGAQEGEWGPHDEYLLDFHAKWLSHQDAAGTPTFSSLFTVTNHYPFDVPEGTPPIEDNVHPNAAYRRFLRSMRYSDACLGKYLDNLRERGLAEKTIVLVLADTGQEYQDDGGQNLSYSGRLTAAASRIPLLLLAEGRLDSPLEIDETGSQVDLMPTLMDIFSMYEAHHAVGTSLRRVCKTRHPYLVHGHAPQFMALQEQPWMYSHSFDAAVGALYNIAQDPREAHDLSGQYLGRTTALRERILSARAFTDKLYDTDAFAPPDCSTPFAFPRMARDRNGQPPEGYPQNLHDVRARQSALGQMKTRSALQERERRLLALYLGSTLSDSDKLLVAQLQYKIIYHWDFGILTRVETDERLRLQKTLDTMLGIAEP